MFNNIRVKLYANTTNTNKIACISPHQSQFEQLGKKFRIPIILLYLYKSFGYSDTHILHVYVEVYTA